jgi:hypothetical protein
MFKYKCEDNSADGRISITESMVDEESGVEVAPDGLAPEDTVFFRYKDGEVSFRFSTNRETSEELSDTVVVLLGFGLRRIKPPSVQAEISADKIHQIARNIEEALLAWPASSRVMNYPPSYLNKKIPYRHVKMMMAGWEGKGA